MKTINFDDLPYVYEYAGRKFLIIKFARLFSRKSIVNLLLGYYKSLYGVEYICIARNGSSNDIIDSRISSDYNLIIDLYLNHLEKYA